MPEETSHPNTTNGPNTTKQPQTTSTNTSIASAAASTSTHRPTDLPIVSGPRLLPKQSSVLIFISDYRKEHPSGPNAKDFVSNAELKKRYIKLSPTEKSTYDQRAKDDVKRYEREKDEMFKNGPVLGHGVTYEQPQYKCFIANTNSLKFNFELAADAAKAADIYWILKHDKYPEMMSVRIYNGNYDSKEEWIVARNKEIESMTKRYKFKKGTVIILGIGVDTDTLLSEITSKVSEYMTEHKAKFESENNNAKANGIQHQVKDKLFLSQSLRAKLIYVILHRTQHYQWKNGRIEWRKVVDCEMLKRFDVKVVKSLIESSIRYGNEDVPKQDVPSLFRVPLLLSKFEDKLDNETIESLWSNNMVFTKDEMKKYQDNNVLNGGDEKNDVVVNTADMKDVLKVDGPTEEDDDHHLNMAEAVDPELLPERFNNETATEKSDDQTTHTCIPTELLPDGYDPNKETTIKRQPKFIIPKRTSKSDTGNEAAVESKHSYVAKLGSQYIVNNPAQPITNQRDKALVEEAGIGNEEGIEALFEKGMPEWSEENEKTLLSMMIERKSRNSTPWKEIAAATNMNEHQCKLHWRHILYMLRPNSKLPQQYHHNHKSSLRLKFRSMVGQVLEEVKAKYDVLADVDCSSILTNITNGYMAVDADTSSLEVDTTGADLLAAQSTVEEQVKKHRNTRGSRKKGGKATQDHCDDKSCASEESSASEGFAQKDADNDPDGEYVPP